ncbi:DUF6194 family protein [Arthrobacter agilis]|uniref:DUF6194 family protein n=1 Tax=Arthrobacter agilis TaxID=37921 RepID=UPI00277FB558|nr:DUF6194 family protein [Arthrobacter agilis]MDQ0735847.1 hypothetical protein [Arthrobacter agilis]
MDEIIEAIRTFDGVLEVAPREGDGTPPIAWGDHFFYYSPDGTVPQRTQPYATIVTKDYPDDTLSNLDAEGRWRLNIHVGSARARELTGDRVDDPDPSRADTILLHPVYGHLGWVAIVNPGSRTGPAVMDLLRGAHEDERRRVARRA